MLLLAAACRGQGSAERVEAPEPLSRTEFTDRVENFFEHDPLVSGKPSRFLIHLTDLSDGAPVERADVTLTMRPSSGAGPELVSKAKIGRVSGIYVAEISAPAPGSYSIEFHVKNPKLDERMTLADFAAR